MGFVIGPVAPENNPTITPQYYNPSNFTISAISFGSTTTVTTSSDHDYVVGQVVKLIIPFFFGAQEINGKQGYVLSIPASNQVVVTIDSLDASAFKPTPLSSTITAATQANPCVLTSVNYYKAGQSIKISGIVGMTELNGNVYSIVSTTSTTISINVDSTSFTAYISGGSTLLFAEPMTPAQIIPIGDVNQGAINSSGRNNTGLYIPGAFIDVSP